MDSQSLEVGIVGEIWRYPVKSMRGEQLAETSVDARGVRGDRALALVDQETGRIASAKHPRIWPELLDFAATYVSAPAAAGALPEVRITFPGGERVTTGQVTTDESDAEARLSARVHRQVRIAQSPVEGATADGYWPDYDWLWDRASDFSFQLPPGTFFDCAAVHLVTSATLARARALALESRFDVCRFRPNFVVETEGVEGFIENSWVGKQLRIGEVLLQIERGAPRCVMTTLAQGALPKDPAVLKTAVQHNGGDIGVYASVVQPGLVRRGDRVALVEPAAKAT